MSAIILPLPSSVDGGDRHLTLCLKRIALWGGSKEVINFPGIFLDNAEFSPCWALLEYIRALIQLACLRVFSVTPWVIVYGSYHVSDCF